MLATKRDCLARTEFAEFSSKVCVIKLPVKKKNGIKRYIYNRLMAEVV